MERLVKDAAKLDKSIDANSLSYENIVKAIHAVQVNMGIYGTTQKEAEHTVTGSLNSMKSAWGNLLTAIGSGENLDQCFDNMISSVEILFDNIMPVVERSLDGVGTLVEKIVPKIADKLPELANKLLPPLIESSVTLVKGLIKALPDIIRTVATALIDILKEQFPLIAEQFPIVGHIFEFFKDNAAKVAKAIKTIVPAVLALVVAFKGFKALSGITSFFSGLKGGKGGKSGGITKFFESMAKTKTTTVLKGIANLAIIVGGVTALAAAFLALSPYIAKLGDTKSFLKTVVVVTVMGAVGTALAELGGIAGKIKVSTVAKGLANMAIMIGGLSALLLLIGAISLIDFDYKRIVHLTLVIGMIGAVGTALSLLGGIVGLIPVAIVAKGLANIAIIMAGMSALFLLIGATSLINFDLTRITHIIAIIGLLGTVGSVLSVFAGIVGMIPIPVVLAGLTNIALVIGGLTAIVVAFGKLSELDGFNEFISTGGQTLVKLFNILGQIVGSAIGGLGEGLTNSLPQIGANISAFAVSLRPMFTMFKGADIEGIGSFFKSLGAFMLQMAGEKILSFFTGGTNFSSLGTQLSEFATGSSGFFKTVAALPENGFTNATKLFDCLAGMKSLPKEGGVVGWFTGGIDYSAISNGLGQLSNEKVKTFFNTVAEYSETGFSNATSLFDCLAGLKSLPKNGGVVGWFSGNVDYKKIASGLGALSSKGVNSFFTMVDGFSQKTFDNVNALFSSLASIGDLPKEGGLWDKLTGDETSTLGNLANDLNDFVTKSKTFFEMVNNLDLTKLNGLWHSLESSQSVTTSVSRILDKNINEMVKKIEALPKKMGDGLKKSGSALADALVSIWKQAAKASAKPVNKVIEGANWILKQFGSDKVIASWTPYAKGTDGHKGGNALVNDGRGAELVQMPNGNTYIPQGKNVFIPNAPKGMKVLPAEQTAAVMGKKRPTFHYADGTGDIDIWDYIDNSKGLISAVSSKYVNYDGVSGLAYHIGKSMVNTITSQMYDWCDKLFDEFGAKSLANYIPSAGVEQWRSTVIRALKMEGLYTPANVERTLYQMQTESGGNPYAINLWDSNAKAGIPSKGLMQCIDPTFQQYARPGYNKNIYDPLSNILASIRYAVARYGSLARAYQGHGYANGGLVTKAGWISEENKPEMVIPLSSDKRSRGIELWKQTGSMLGLSSYTPESSASAYTTNSVENNSYAPVFNLYVSGSDNDRTRARQIKQEVNDALDEYFENFARKNRRVREV